MTAVLTMLDVLDIDGDWVQKGGSWWLAPENATPREIARSVLRQRGRFISITVTELPEHAGMRMDYHWDIDGKLVTFTFTAENAVESVFDICPAADWIEREIHEYFAIDFCGRAYEPLFLRPGQKPGVNLREEEA
jgi:hypothetical protein